MSAPAEETEEAYYLEQVTLDEDDDDDFEYTEVDVPEDDEEAAAEEDDDDENLEQALASLQAVEEKASGSPKQKFEESLRPAVTRRPEVIDDFIRNVLLKLGAPQPHHRPSCAPAHRCTHGRPAVACPPPTRRERARP